MALLGPIWGHLMSVVDGFKGSARRAQDYQLESNSKRYAAAEGGNLKEKCRTRDIMDAGETSYSASRLAWTIPARSRPLPSYHLDRAYSDFLLTLTRCKMLIAMTLLRT
ncbi:hypothetical protein FIBSPDRAFT_413165 [Athelia psychrophila]|uniref:Uncharacterized protein n=1 Tax=Athelia psychrophila TaxID=1759441 RepID=A0A167UWE1_9AGAM|nr:hypothetical protein FIBSPDRAFT_413165 [Fibularhizoctonia sp. CBS 109695]